MFFFAAPQWWRGKKWRTGLTHSYTSFSLVYLGVLLAWFHETPINTHTQPITLPTLDLNRYVYSPSFGRVLSTLHAHEDAVSAVASCRSRLVSGGWDAQVKLWDIEACSGESGVVLSEPVAEYNDHETEVRVCIVFIMSLSCVPF